MTRRVSERDALLAAVHETPDDDAPRLVYADWLEEHGDAGDQDRAAFIRAGVRSARLALDDPERVSAEIQSAVLFHQQGPAGVEWYDGLPKVLRKRYVGFRRGFPFGITAAAAQLVRSANTLSRRTAVQEVNLEGVNDEMTAAHLGGLPLMGRLRSLVGASMDRPGPWVALLAGPVLTGLERVTMFGYQAGHHAGLSRLLEASAVRGVRTLEPTFLYDVTLTERRRGTLDAIARSDFPLLRSFRLGMSEPFSAEEMQLLLRAPYLPRLDELHLQVGLASDAATMLSGVPCASRLRALTVFTPERYASDLGSALSGWRFPSLTWLQLNRATDEAVRRLADLPFAANLRVLDLFAHRLSPEGMAILSSGRFGGLAWLGLWNRSVGDDCLRALASSPGLPELRYLDLHGGRVTVAGLDALAASPHLPRLEAVSVGEYGPEPFPPEWVARFAHRFIVLPPPLHFLSTR